jgi:molybdopterin molybdotransferase
MINENEARAKILESIETLPLRRVPLGEAFDCFAAEDYFAQVALPPFDNSAMDGYAVMASSCVSGRHLRVTGEQPAAVDRRLQVSAGEAVRIFTGAPLPGGADAVVMQEDVTREGDHITVNTSVESGDFIRRKGCDLSEGQKIVTTGERITSTIAALLASQGFPDVAVGGEVDAGVISTGDEVVGLAEQAKAGQIYDSNSVLLAGLLRKTGVTLGRSVHCADDERALTQSMQTGSAHRVLIITGGVSVGEHDLVKSVVTALGGTIDIWRVAIKPGKPFLFGRIGECVLFGLPGNPVSAFVTFLLLVRPALLKMMGANDAALELPRVSARLAAGVGNEGNRAHYLRGRYEGGNFTPIGRQESHALFGLSQSNALLRVLPGISFKSGELADVEVWD